MSKGVFIEGITVDMLRNACLEAVEELMNEGDMVDMEVKPTEWIPVGDRLPDEHEWIGTKQFGTTISDLINITFEVDGQRFVKVMSLQNGKLSLTDKQTMDVFYKGWKMIAWMPLPPVYQGE